MAKTCHKPTIPQENHNFYGCSKPKYGWSIFVLTLSFRFSGFLDPPFYGTRKTSATSGPSVSPPGINGYKKRTARAARCCRVSVYWDPRCMHTCMYICIISIYIYIMCIYILCIYIYVCVYCMCLYTSDNLSF